MSDFDYGIADVFPGDVGQPSTGASTWGAPTLNTTTPPYDPYADDATNQVTTQPNVDSTFNPAKDSSTVGGSPSTNVTPTVDLGSLGGIQNIGGTTWQNLLPTLLNKIQNITPAQAAALATGIGSLYGGWGKPTDAGYKGSIPKLTATRSILPGAFSSPSTPSTYGAPRMGKRYFTPIKYAAQGGIMSGAPRYLRGGTDGMADKLNTTIDGQQPAKLSHGEFVIPADVVSHLGNGNSDAGAQHLYRMMDRVRRARTGNPKQGRKINPEKFTQFVGGGVVAFPTGGEVTTPAPSTTTAPSTTNPNLSPTSSVSTSSALSPWAGDYITNMLGQGQALGNMDYQPYEGPLTAGASPLQQQGWDKLSSWQAPGAFNTATGILENTSKQLGPIGSIQDYMNPYVQRVLDTQMSEARRQADISGLKDNAKLVQAGAFGGGRDAIMRSEHDRNLLSQLEGIESKGLNTAWDNAIKQRYQDAQLQQGIGTALSGVGAQQGQSEISGINALTNAGATQREVEQQGITADINQFNNEREWPYKQLEFQRSLLSGLPVGTSTQSVGTTPYDQFGNAVTNSTDLYNKIKAIIGG